MPPERPAPTLHDVAAKAGVSTATVSRTLNFPDKVSAVTRDKVGAAILALGYSPNFGAKVMAARRTHTIGAIIPTMENAIFARGLQAFQDELRQHGYTMLVASTGYDADVEADQIRTLVARGADALLLIGHARDAAISEFLDRQQVPTLVAWASNPEAALPAVGFDNREAMRRMANQVIAMGHTRCALISAATADNDRALGRLLGIKAAMQDHGLDPETLHVIETSYGVEEGAAAFDQCIAVATRPTAIFCGNDVLAVGALRRARDRGLAVPDDLSIIGFDDIELAQIADPPLTTVRVPHQEMGRLAATTLVEWLRSGVQPDTITLEAHPVLRATLGPAR